MSAEISPGLNNCLRFVSRQDNHIKERFVGFTDVHELDASSLAGEIMNQLGQLGLDPSKCQCYDGAWLSLFYIHC